MSASAYSKTISLSKEDSTPLNKYVEVVARKIVEERALATSMRVNLDASANANNRNSNNNNNKNDTIFGSKFANINFSEYGDKMKKYYDGVHC